MLMTRLPEIYLIKDHQNEINLVHGQKLQSKTTFVKIFLLTKLGLSVSSLVNHSVSQLVSKLVSYSVSQTAVS